MNELLIKIDERQLCSYLLDLAKEYYADPDHQRAYNDWCARKNKKGPAGGQSCGVEGEKGMSSRSNP